ncbi:MAG TPA: (2Fe-2S)-binding protein [Kofleriaceae bacterium]|nr:(2Fe-2S)-binding protein [Kofleriaceae bacterium]
MIVCFCHPTSDRDVDAIIDDGARTVEDIGRRCGAGTGCGSCLEDLRDRLAAKGCGGCPRDAAGPDEARDAAPLVAIRPR